MNNFDKNYGFARADIGLHNWRERPYSRFAFQHVSEFVPSSVILATPDKSITPLVFDSVMAGLPAGSAIAGEDLGSFLARSQTDRFLISKAGKVLMNWSPNSSDPDLPHIAFSVSKSFTGTLLGILEAEGLVDWSKTVSHYLPAMQSGGFGDCTIQHVMDMRVSLDFTEEYLNEDGDYARYRRATLWNPPLQGRDQPGLEQLLESIPKGRGPHGGPFHYMSPCSDLLGILIERVSGTPYCELMSELIWKPMGASSNAFMTVDAMGAPRGAGGLSLTGRDLLAFGEMMLNRGSSGTRQIVPEAWIDDMMNNGDSHAWESGNFSGFIKGGRYRNQWYQLAKPSKAFLAIGIHGQWLFCDPDTEVVIAKLSSQSLPQNDALDVETVSVLSNLANAL